MTGGEFFLAAPQVAASPGRRAAPACSWHVQTKGPLPSRGSSPGRHSPVLGLGSERGRREELGEPLTEHFRAAP